MNVHVIMIEYYWYFKTRHKARTQNPLMMYKKKNVDQKPTLVLFFKPSQDLIQVKAQSGEESRRRAEWGWGCSDGEGQSEGGPHLPVLWRGEWISDLLVQENKELLNFASVFQIRHGLFYQFLTGKSNDCTKRSLGTWICRIYFYS